MSVNTDISPGQALVYSVTEDDNIEYMFRLYNGEEGKISLSVIESLNLNILALPAVVSTDSLAEAMYGGHVSLSEVLLQVIQKADTNFVKKVVQQRVSIDRFRAFVAKAAMSDTVNLEFLKKADKEYVDTALHGKVDRGEVYTIDKIHEVMMQFLGARAVYNIKERDSLEYGLYPYVWVLDASDDNSSYVENPALYKWNKTHWVYLGTVGNFGSGTVDFSNYYTRAEVDELVRHLLPEIVGNEDVGKAITVSYEFVNGQPVYKYVLSEIQTGQVDTSELERKIQEEAETRETTDRGLAEAITSADQRLTEAINNVEARLTIVENTLGHADDIVTTILTDEFGQEV